MCSSGYCQIVRLIPAHSGWSRPSVIFRNRMHDDDTRIEKRTEPFMKRLRIFLSQSQKPHNVKEESRHSPPAFNALIGLIVPKQLTSASYHQHQKNQHIAAPFKRRPTRRCRRSYHIRFSHCMQHSHCRHKRPSRGIPFASNLSDFKTTFPGHGIHQLPLLQAYTQYNRHIYFSTQQWRRLNNTS